MIYCVELAFTEPTREAEWSAWYSKHLGVLLSVPGFSTAQRFQSTSPCRAPYLAAYSVTGPGVFDSAPYRARGGRASPGEWVPLMVNWDRNVFDGVVQMPEVKPDQVLLVVDGTADIENASAKFPVKLTPLTCVGLDRTVTQRGIAVLAASEFERYASYASENTRFFKPLTPRLRGAQ